MAAQNNANVSRQVIPNWDRQEVPDWVAAFKKDPKELVATVKWWRQFVWECCHGKCPNPREAKLLYCTTEALGLWVDDPQRRWSIDATPLYEAKALVCRVHEIDTRTGKRTPPSDESIREVLDRASIVLRRIQHLATTAEIIVDDGPHDGYVPMKDLLDDCGGSYNTARAAIKDGNIPTRKPSPRRLLVHAGRWHEYMSHQAKQAFNALDSVDPESSVADSLVQTLETYVDGATSRKAGIVKNPKRKTRQLPKK